jgi:hypothetical protein
MSKHWVPEDDKAGSGQPSIDDDTGGHMLRSDEEPGARAGEQPDFRFVRDDEDDTEGHVQATDKVPASTDEGDAEGPGFARG